MQRKVDSDTVPPPNRPVAKIAALFEGFAIAETSNKTGSKMADIAELVVVHC